LVSWYVPAAHAEQAWAEAGENVPTLHAVAASDPASQ